MSSLIITKRFDEVFDLALGRTPSRGDKSYWGGLHTWVSIADMSCGKYISTSKEKITDKALFETNIPIVKKGTVIMSFKLSIGKVCIAESDIYTNEAIMAFKPNNKYTILPEYLYYYLQAYKWECSNEVVLGFTLNKKTISQSLITFPESLSEQQRIVDILDAEFAKIDALKENAEKNLQNAKDLFQAVVNSLFNGKFPFSTLGKECEFVRGPFGGSLKKSCFTEDGYPVYEQQHAIYNKFTFRYFINEDKYNEMKRFTVKTGDLIMSCSGTIGKVAIIPEGAPQGIINQALLKLTPKGNVLSEYLKWYMNSSFFYGQIAEQSKGVAIKNVASVSILKTLTLPLPSLCEQIQISNKLNEAENMCRELEDNYKRTIILCNDLKQALLRKAFDGEL